MSLFDYTLELHALSASERMILEQAALLPSAPARRTKKKPYKAALELVKAQPNLELEAAQRKTLAAVVALWHRKLRRKDLKQLELTAAQQRAALTLAAILQIAEGLDGSGSGETAIEKVEPSASGMRIIRLGLPRAQSEPMKGGAWLGLPAPSLPWHRPQTFS